MRVRHDNPAAAHRIATALADLLPADREPVFVCVGTDRSTGDSLGPLVGRRLARLAPSLAVYGTIDKPVHASNLTETLGDVRRDHRGGFVVGVDASLGRLDAVGVVAVEATALTPGAGVNKPLPRVGEAQIAGMVGPGGFMEFFVLQNVRLSLVMAMARVIADGILGAMTLRQGVAEAAAAGDPR